MWLGSIYWIECIQAVLDFLSLEYRMENFELKSIYK